jgi:hypothetical protein
LRIERTEAPFSGPVSRVSGRTSFRGGVLAQLEATTDTDLLRSALKTIVEAFWSADAAHDCNASRGERTPERTHQRNGSRTRPWDRRVGSIELAVSKQRPLTIGRPMTEHPPQEVIVGVTPTCNCLQ